MSSPPPLLSRREQAIVLGVIVLAVTVFLVCYQRIADALFPYFEFAKRLGPWAYVVLTLAYIPACVLTIPNTFLAVGAGWVLGATGGTLVSLFGAALGGSVNYAIGRRFGKSWFEHNVEQNHHFRAVEIACRKQGFQIVLLTRLIPLFHTNAMSYFFGVARVQYGPFVLGTLIGLIPRTVLLVLSGAAAKTLTEAQQSPDILQSPPVLYTVLGVSVIAFLYTARIARRALQQALAGVETESAKPADTSPQ